MTGVQTCALPISLRPHELQHTRPPCPSPTSGVHSNSCPSISDAIQPSHPLDGKFEITYRPEERKPVKEYLAPQKRFRHLTDKHIDKIQKYVDAECDELGL